MKLNWSKPKLFANVNGLDQYHVVQEFQPALLGYGTYLKNIGSDLESIRIKTKIKFSGSVCFGQGYHGRWRLQNDKPRDSIEYTSDKSNQLD